jgi:DNA-binding NtrC family response regulator
MGTTFLSMGTLNPSTDTTARDVASHIRRALEAARISRLEASERTGIPRSTFYRKVDGLGKPFDVDELAAVAGVLGTDVAGLLRDATEGRAA